jgi:cobalt-zinc-cadmium efflux system membrane fusion protein
MTESHTPPAGSVPAEGNDLPAAPGAVPKPGRARRLLGRLWHAVPAVVALGVLAGVLYAGQRTGWTLPKASALRGEGEREDGDWCAEHTVPESICVECDADLLPRPPRTGWNKEFGVHDCPFDDPSIAQTPLPARVTPDDLARARRALAFAPRPPNGKTCRQHHRRIQLASADVFARLGIGLQPVTTAAVSEGVEAPGEIGYDPTRVARAAPRAAGTVWRVERQVGDKVRRGDVLALVEAAEVGKAKAEFQQAVVQFELKRETLAKLKPMAGSTVAGRDVQAAEAAVEEAEVRLLAAGQALSNLGMPVRAEDVSGLPPADLARKMQFLGLPDALAKELAGRTGSSNLLPVTAPLDGEVVERSAVKDQATDPARPLFVVADTARVWLTLRVRQEDADRVKPGQAVRFHHPGHTGRSAWDAGVVAWVSPAADERTRAVPVRVDLPNPEDRHRANTFGTARIVLREEKDAVVVPTEAVHWEGCCHVVFVADRGFDEPSGFKVFHVRKVRPGAKDVTPAGTPVTEVIAGVLPGERVAVANSGVLRSELLRNNLGAG